MVNLQETIKQIRADRAGSHDVLVSPSQLDVDKYGRVVYQGTSYAFTNHSYKQWCKKLHVPADFVRRCPVGEGPATQKALFDHFRASIDGEVTLRLRKGTHNVVRAVLPAKYVVLDNDEVLQRLATFIGDTNMHVEDVILKDGNMDVKLLHNDTVAIGKHPNTNEDDIHRFGYFMRNSEIGTIPDVRGNFLVFRSACTNGMVFSSALIGKNKKTPLLSTSHLGSDQNLITDLETSFAQFQRMVPKAKEALETAQNKVLTTQEAEHALNRLLDQANLSEVFDAQVAQEFRREPNMTKFGIAQAMTAAARQLSARARSKVETLAGDFIIGNRSRKN